MAWPCLQSYKRRPFSRESGTARACGGTVVLNAQSPFAAFALQDWPTMPS